ncbi:MAG: excisionase family DNA-binding protein [Sporichthyaceae bacterium]
MDEKLLYRVEEAGHFLNMGRSTVFQEMAAGRLKSVRIGKSRRISRAALEEYVAQLEQNAAAAAS